MSSERFFNEDQRRLVAALAADIIPGDADSPGATEAGVLEFIDGAVAGWDARFQPVYTAGLAGIDAYCEEAHGARYADCSAAQRLNILEQLEAGTLGSVRDGWVQAIFFVVWCHTTQGFLCDPSYGGNKDLVGWKAVGFPGAQYGYTEEQNAYGAVLADLPPLTLADARAQYEAAPDRYFISY